MYSWFPRDRNTKYNDNNHHALWYIVYTWYATTVVYRQDPTLHCTAARSDTGGCIDMSVRSVSDKSIYLRGQKDIYKLGIDPQAISKVCLCG